MRLIMLLCGSVLAASIVGGTAQERIPKFSPGIHFAWKGVDPPPFLIPSRDGPQPVSVDPSVAAKVYAAEAFPIVDLNNPNLQPWVIDVLRPLNELVASGKPLHFRSSSCWPVSIQGLHALTGVRPLYFAQTASEVVIISQYNNEVRRVFLNRQHSANPEASWYGESVGHYENGDTLVVDTIGFNDKASLDMLRTPHTRDYHVVERFKLSEDGRAMEVNIRVEDPGVFKAPYEVTRHYRIIEDPWPEHVCAENPHPPIDQGLEPLPQDDTPDF